MDRRIRNLPDLVQTGDIWVLNDTKVIPARLVGQKESGGKAEILLLEPAGTVDVWHAWGKANKPLKPGTVIMFSGAFYAEVLERKGKNIEVRLIADDVSSAIETHGHMPLPPYINRPDSEADKSRYQTVFARHSGGCGRTDSRSAFNGRTDGSHAVSRGNYLHMSPCMSAPVHFSRCRSKIWTNM